MVAIEPARGCVPLQVREFRLTVRSRPMILLQSAVQECDVTQIKTKRQISGHSDRVADGFSRVSKRSLG